MKLNKDILKIREDAEKLADKQSRRLLSAYKASMNEIKASLGAVYANNAEDGIISASKRQRMAMLKSIEGQIVTESNKLGSIDVKITSKILAEGYTETYYKTLYTIDKGINIDFTLLNPKIVEKAVNKKYKSALFSDRIWKNKALLTKRLKSEIEKGIIKGEGVDKVARRISKTFGSSAYESKRLINTEMARVVSEAQADIYADADVIMRVLYDATLDDKTSDICQGLDGRSFDANEDYPKPPQHPNCRSVIIPIIDGWNPSKRKDNETKEIINYTTYHKWKQSRGI